MRKPLLSLSVAAVLALQFAGNLSAQAKPDFSGKWTLISSSADYPGRGTNFIFGPEAVVSQDATTLTVARVASSNQTRFLFSLDGSPSRNSYKASSRKTWVVVSKATWEGNTLVITTVVETVTTVDGNGGSVVWRDTDGRSQSIMRWSMSASGHLSMQTTALNLASPVPGPATENIIYKKS